MSTNHLFSAKFAKCYIVEIISLLDRLPNLSKISSDYLSIDGKIKNQSKSNNTSDFPHSSWQRSSTLLIQLTHPHTYEHVRIHVLILCATVRIHYLVLTDIACGPGIFGRSTITWKFVSTMSTNSAIQARRWITWVHIGFNIYYNQEDITHIYSYTIIDHAPYLRATPIYVLLLFVPFSQWVPW